jgi:uncharacterized protein YqiB (DUF1249 family)
MKANDALESARSIFQTESKKRINEYLGEWNEIFLYLEERKRIETINPIT